MIENINWVNYFFHSDFTPEREALEIIPLGPVNETNAMFLAVIMSNIDTGVGKELWNDKADVVEWSTAGATVIYNGRNAQKFPTKSKMKYQLTLEFPETSHGPKGRIYLCFNDAPVIPVEDPAVNDTPDPVEQ